MSAELLREAAALMVERAGWGSTGVQHHPAEALAVADLLIGEAARIDRDCGPGPHIDDAFDANAQYALGIAHAYLAADRGDMQAVVAWLRSAS